MGTVRLEQQGLMKRQFQLGGLLGGMFREVSHHYGRHIFCVISR